MWGRTWRNVERGESGEIWGYLVKEGGVEDVKASFEVWRIGFSDSTFTYCGRGYAL
jgi:hypothetical protein